MTLGLLFVSTASAQRIERLILTPYTGDGLTPETAFCPEIVRKLGLDFEDITSVVLPDSVGLVVIRANFDSTRLALVEADTSCLVLSANPALNNRQRFNTFLGTKKNGARVVAEIGRRANVDYRDIILELKTIDREKRPGPRRGAR